MENRILVTAKVNPDLDGTACALAYAFLLNAQEQKADAVLFGQLQAETLYFVEKHGLTIPVQPDSGLGYWSRFILVDASSTAGMPKVVTKAGVIEIIDHRETSGGDEFPNAKVQNELVGATATLVWEKIGQASIVLPKDLALLIYGAIFHNSLNLLASNTTERDKKAVEKLEKTYGFSRDTINQMFRHSTEQAMKDIGKAIRIDMKEYLEIGWGQLILYDVRQRLRTKEKEIETALSGYTSSKGLQLSFLNVIDVFTNENIIYCSDTHGQELISQALGVTFTGNWTHHSPAWLRKQIMPLIKKLLN